MAPPGGFESPPDFAKGSALLEGAYEMAVTAHHGPRRRGDTGIDHPVSVARLLHEHEFPEVVVAAALLHDVIEDTDTELGEIEAEFGPEVAELVGEMTEDETIAAYRERKAEHRGRVAGNSCVAAIYAADKLAKVRKLNERGEHPEQERLEHYRRTLVELRAAEPAPPFLSELAVELDRLG
jgi:GTP diphosphokinase / guanosine-3',5'-bis(diphosphate) 3'-diphosphatase